MPGIFISYAKEDRDIAVKLEKAFKEKKIPVCIEKESIYKKEEWPKAMAEAVAAQNLFLLLWSQHAAASQPVQFEAVIAAKMNKPIIPICLDTTPLPAELAADTNLHIGEFDQTIQTITEKIAASPPSHHHQNHQIITRLAQTEAPDIATILKAIDPPNEASQKKKRSTRKFPITKWTGIMVAVVGLIGSVVSIISFVRGDKNKQLDLTIETKIEEALNKKNAPQLSDSTNLPEIDFQYYLDQWAENTVSLLSRQKSSSINGQKKLRRAATRANAP